MKLSLSVVISSIIVLAATVPCPAEDAPLVVKNLRCEYLANPLGLDSTAPRLSWTLLPGQPELRGQAQSAYQVLVASTPEALAKDQGDLWDSGQVKSDQSNQLAYAGSALKSNEFCCWKVRVWDQNGKPSGWSESAQWSMGLLGPEDWQATWIGYDAAYHASSEADNALFSTSKLDWAMLPGKEGTVYVRHVVQIPADQKIRRAVMVLYPDNQAQVSANGTVCGTAARWEKAARIDVTKVLKAGDNVIGLQVTNSDFLPPAAIGKLVVEYEAGESLVAPLDNSWKASQNVAEGWDKPGFDDHDWSEVGKEKKTPWGTAGLQDQFSPPAPYLRKDFQVAKPVKRARLFVTALGLYELHLNGEKVGNDVLTPGWTDFNKRVYYQTYDVTARVRNGANAIGAILGDGWFAGDLAYTGKRNHYGGTPRFMAQLVMEMSDGTTQTIVSDNSWKASFGPILHGDLIIGCEYDAARELKGWDSAGFDDHDWSAVNTGSTGAGSEQTEQTVDVTSLLNTATKNGRLSVTVGNETMGGDPALDKVKELQVEYRLAGQNLTKKLAENQQLDLSGPDLTIVKARYGCFESKKKDNSERLVQAAVAEPSRKLEELPALKMTEPKPGIHLFDLGQNMVGWARVKLQGARGQRITVRYGEMLNRDGTLYTANLRGAMATDFYDLAGTGSAETFEPYFTFHGFRYVEIRGLTNPPDLSTVTGIVVHSDIQRTGAFECSNPLLNQLYHNIIWGQKGNYLEVPPDCPQRDERMGWTGDTQFFIPTAAYNYNVAPFFSRWLTTIAEDSQLPNGSFSHVAPNVGQSGGATAWGDAALICDWNIYHTYGDTKIITTHYAAFERYMDFLAGKTKDGVSHVGGFGDWLNKGGGAKPEVMDTAYYAYLAGLMTDMSTAIGKTDRAQHYAEIHNAEVKAFANFIHPDGSVEGSSQTAFALAFTMDLVPDDLRAAAAGQFVQEIKKFDSHLATGFIGTPRLLPGLHLAGHDDIAYKVLLQDTYPSWLYQVKLGATTMWERWDGWTPERGFQTIGMNSFNHYAFGAVGQYLYSVVGGIQADSPGYKTIRIQPIPGGGLTYAKTSFDSIYGPITCNWKVDGTNFNMDVTIPPNTVATVYVPAHQENVMESGKPAAQSDGLKFAKMDGGSAVYTAGSGTYHFTASGYTSN